MLALPGQLFSFGSKPIVAQHQSRVDGMADFRVALRSGDLRTGFGKQTVAIVWFVPARCILDAPATSWVSALGFCPKA